MYKNIARVFVLSLFFSSFVNAETTGSVTFASDYLFNGVSQTDEKPALQFSLDYADESGWYVGTWSSNVDFGDGTDYEVDVYAGYGGEFESGITYDVSLLYYAYFGGSTSSEGSYPELVVSFGLGDTTLSASYSWDYFGTEADHVILALDKSMPVSESWTLNMGINMSTSLDDDLYTWDGNDEAYIHFYLSADTQWRGLDFSIGVHSTDLDTYGETRLLGTVSRSFSF
ncbi:hypothetical protein DRW07_00870 [Alteromonas sediminis]|uniref:TIGR02001 family outer membrane protein n=1 Tax=Alteromonas sediminis TaxID=2259342 RepID=A0A3N5Y9M2_9ALTE|nr:TorF family putative porin [Alteromonas sediminis]RPJ67999.1 hypothetical protein DRW07_00870 [Alteromonas sediminis]